MINPPRIPHHAVAVTPHGSRAVPDGCGGRGLQESEKTKGGKLEEAAHGRTISGGRPVRKIHSRG